MNDLARLSPYACNDCKRHGRIPARLACPGVCPSCAHDARVEEATQRLAPAVRSIHPERRWARLFDSEMMHERLQVIGWWRIIIGGTVRHNGNSYVSLIKVRDELDANRLVISGTDTGIGKTSIAVALMRECLDDAQGHFEQRNESLIGFATSARFVSAIDLTDPEMLKQATGASLLVLDDAGVEGNCGGFEAERRRAIVGDLLDRRERSKKLRTIVTTFGSHETWGKWYGGRIARLYWEMDTSAVLELRKVA